MEVVTTVAEVRARSRAARSRAASVGLVPTMGALHAGHLSLIRRSAAECGFTIVTLFVNPTQFSPEEDLSRYPRDFDGDRALAESAGTHLLFAPEAAEVYPPGYRTFVTVDGLTSRLCGASRPGHFRGVTTVVCKLFNACEPDRAYFGEKDFQQLQVIRRMTRDLNLPIDVVGCPIVREPDGLAMSSRNRYLSSEERRSALALSRALEAARSRFDAGERTAERLLTTARAALAGEPEVRPDYLELVDAESLAPVERIEVPAVLAVAAFVGRTRLIDNTVLHP